MTCWDAIWLNVRAATFDATGEGDYGVIEDAAVASSGGRIAWVGPRSALPTGWSAKFEYDGRGGWLTPGLIDCHTHIVYAGSRAGEFEQRLQGASYEQIAKAGGGIVSTVRATRAASELELLRQSSRRVAALLAEGVTTLEIKSGYGLDTATESRILKVARLLGESCAIGVKTSFLGAHALPPEFTGRPDDYIDLVCDEMLPAVHAAGLADAVDAFCE